MIVQGLASLGLMKRAVLHKELEAATVKTGQRKADVQHFESTVKFERELVLLHVNFDALLNVIRSVAKFQYE